MEENEIQREFIKACITESSKRQKVVEDHDLSRTNGEGDREREKSLTNLSK